MKKYLLFLLIVSTGCHSSSINNDNKHYTEVFRDYMQSVFHKELPDTLTNFIVIPKMIGCVGCKTTVLNSLVNGMMHPNCVLIANIDPPEIPDFKYRYLRDSLNVIERLDLKTRSTTLIRVKGKKVIDIIEITPDKIDSVINSLEQHAGADE